jgi:hypothetical protein
VRPTSVRHDLPAGTRVARGTRRTRVDGDDDGLRADCEAMRSSRSGSATAAVLTLTLSAPAASSMRASSTLRTPPPIVNGMESCGAALDDVDHDVARVARRRDVEEHELVGAGEVVAARELDRIARVAEPDEVDALHDPPGLDVEARDDARRERSLGSGRRCVDGGDGALIAATAATAASASSRSTSPL